MSKEARARIKINDALKASGWRFFDSAEGPANVVLEPQVKLAVNEVDALGEDFEHTASGYVDFLLLARAPLSRTKKRLSIADGKHGASF